MATSVTAFIGRAQRGRTDSPIRIFSFADFERECGGLWADSDLGHAVQQFFLNGGAQALIVRVVNDSNAEAAPDPPAELASIDLPATSGDPVELTAISAGAWGNALRATVSYDTGQLGAAGADEFHLTIDEVDADAIAAGTAYEDAILRQEEYRFLSVDPLATRWVGGILEAQSALARVLSAGSERPSEISREALVDGDDGPAPTSLQMQSAVDRLDLADVVNLIVVPRYTALPVDEPVYTAALAWAEANRAVLLVDPDDGWSDYQNAADLGAFSGLRSANSCFLYPRVHFADPLKDNLTRDFGPSAAVAGVMARTDATRGVWKAPAGLEATLRGVTHLDDTLTEDRIGVLNARGVNALRSLPVVGSVVWGARSGVGADTLASEWKYTSVRRTALFIEESLFRGLQWAVFEPNDEPLWAQIRLAVGNFMGGLFRQGAFQGSTPREAYLVRCDSSTTTPDDVNRGIVNVIVGFAPLKPAEFVVLHFTQIAGQSAA